MKMPSANSVIGVAASVMVVLFLVATALSMRYQVTSQPTGNEVPLVIVCDTWTGKVSITSTVLHHMVWVEKFGGLFTYHLPAGE